MHPFLDLSKLSSEEIFERLTKSYSYLSAQIALGHNATVQSINEVINALENEQRTRMQKTRDDEFSKKFPNANNPIEIGKLED